MIARELASGGSNPRGRPRQADLKTAVNRIYYALFHTLAIIVADAATGKGARTRKDPAWTHTARVLDHQTARRECQRIVAQALLSTGVRRAIRRHSVTPARKLQRRSSRIAQQFFQLWQDPRPVDALTAQRQIKANDRRSSELAIHHGWSSLHSTGWSHHPSHGC